VTSPPPHPPVLSLTVVLPSHCLVRQTEKKEGKGRQTEIDARGERERERNKRRDGKMKRLCPGQQYRTPPCFPFLPGGRAWSFPILQRSLSRALSNWRLLLCTGERRKRDLDRRGERKRRKIEEEEEEEEEEEASKGSNSLPWHKHTYCLQVA